ncbi:hypothetical protein CRG98_010628 [Punica granatum]|uniref:DUF7745 domain-containing protein n=1 Tax=Punica granatum TaxID=22663 RepID=A0A2I0KKC3_PUNGR|nr:hypothetical protein CRG98_010628 [Punica granatum]
MINDTSRRVPGASRAPRDHRTCSIQSSRDGVGAQNRRVHGARPKAHAYDPRHLRAQLVRNYSESVSNLLGIPTQEIHQELQQGWDHGIRITWLSDWTLLRALTPSTASYQRDAYHGFLLLVFGTLLFPYSPNLIDEAIAQVVLQAVGGHSYMEALLAETVWSLDYVREVRRGRIRGSPHLLQIWLLAHVRPFCSSHPFSYIIDERSLIKRLVPVIPPPEHSFSEWRHFWRELTPARFLWIARWNPDGPMITGYPGIDIPAEADRLPYQIQWADSTSTAPARFLQIREVHRQRGSSTIQCLYFPEHPTDEERAFSATSAYVARSTQAAMRAELRAIREERDRLRCELVDSRAEVANYRELQTELARARARVAHLEREMARLSARLDRVRARALHFRHRRPPRPSLFHRRQSSLRIRSYPHRHLFLCRPRLRSMPPLRRRFFRPQARLLRLILKPQSFPPTRLHNLTPAFPTKHRRQ